MAAGKSSNKKQSLIADILVIASTHLSSVAVAPQQQNYPQWK